MTPEEAEIDQLESALADTARELMDCTEVRLDAQARANKYEQALRAIMHECSFYEQAYHVARAALDKPGTEGENSANEVENQPDFSKSWQHVNKT